MALIEFAHVQKAFGEKVVYRDLNLQVEKGEALTIIGGSGQGKSVMLKMLIGLLSVDSGTIHFDGRRIDQLPEKEMAGVRRRVQMLFQGAALFDSMTVAENVGYGLREIGWKEGPKLRKKVEESLEYVGLEGRGGEWPSSLSSGMKKRVGLARAIAIEPDVLLYDEPTTGLDPNNISRICDLIVYMQEQLSVTSIVVTHDMPSAFRVSDRIAMIHEGYIVFSGTPHDVIRSEDPAVKDFVEGNAPEDEDTQALLRSAG